MKKFALALILLGLLLPGGFAPHALWAAADASCVSDPSSGPVGTSFAITCTGFTPNRYVYAYAVEPSGAARELYGHSGSIKADETGTIHFTQETRAFDPYWFKTITLQSGAWTFVAEELGAGKTVLHRGETRFTITGGTESVAGAALEATPSIINKPLQGYQHFDTYQGRFNILNDSEPVTFSGSGFQAGEMVSFWVEPANGGCSSVTEHHANTVDIVEPGIVVLRLTEEFNTVIYDGFGAQEFVTLKANESGNVTAAAYFTSLACEGKWHFVARGNLSGNGADTWVTVIGNRIATNASLTADPDKASAMFGTVHFTGAGFGANEQLSCWLTNPQGSTLGFPSDTFFTGTFLTVTYRDQQIFADTNGETHFSLVTGSSYEHLNWNVNIGGVISNYEQTILHPLASEGALGEYAMTCRGITTGNGAIARFTLTGGLVDP